MMMYAAMAAICAVTLLLLTRPWWSRSADLMQRRAANVAAYETRIAEIETEVRAGLQEPAAADQLKQETAARLLADADTTTPVAAGASRLWWVALLVPLFAGTWYAAAGSWRQQAQIVEARDNPQPTQDASIAKMVEGLAQRLQQQPEDAEGWAMLGRSYAVLERYDDAVKAYERANALTQGRNADWLVAEGESLALARNRDLLGRPQQLFAAALQLDAQHIGALWFAGLAAAQQEDFAGARKHWSVLSKLELPEPLRAVLDSRLAELSGLGGGMTEAPTAQAEKSADLLALQVEVSLAPELRSALKSGQTLFVFAKAEQGPPMPLAVQRLAAFQFPLSVKLDDSMAMMPGLKLSQFERWTVTARITAGGSVQAQSGDLEGSITVARGDAGKPQKLVVTRKLP